MNNKYETQNVEIYVRISNVRKKALYLFKIGINTRHIQLILFLINYSKYMSENRDVAPTFSTIRI